MALPLLLLLLVVAVVAMWLSSRRFAARERKLGKWDDQGPMVETQPPPHRVRNAGMEERLEVIGEWDSPVVRDRRKKGEDPPASTSSGD